MMADLFLWGGVAAAAAWSWAGTRWTRHWPGTHARRRFPVRLRGADLAMVGLAWIFVTLLGPSAEPDRFSVADVGDWKRFLTELRVGGRAGTPSPARRLWSLLDDRTRAEVDAQLAGNEPDVAAVASQVAAAISAALRQPDFPGTEDFAHVPSYREYRELFAAQDDSVPDEARSRLHRGLLEAAFPDQIRPSIRSLLFLVAVENTVLIAVIPAILWLAARIRPYQLGLHCAHGGSFFLFGVAQWAIWAPLTFAANLLVRAYLGQETLHPVQDFFLAPRGALDWLLVIYTTTFAAPVLEELLFRGLLQAWLVNRMGMALGIGVSAGLFGLAHGSTWPDPIPLALLGIGLGLTYQRTRSLVAPMALHGVFNGVMVGVGALYG